MRDNCNLRITIELYTYAAYVMLIDVTLLFKHFREAGNAKGLKLKLNVTGLKIKKPEIVVVSTEDFIFNHPEVK